MTPQQTDPLARDRYMTVVIPVRNRAALLPRCLDSVKAQTWRPMRVIVVDNGSTDGTAAAARCWAAVHSDADFTVDILSEPLPGAVAPRRRGLAEVRSDRVMFFDSDDTMRPELVATAMQLMDRTGCDIAVWRVCMHFLDGTERNSRCPGGDWMQQHLLHAVLRTQGYAVRTEVLRAAGGWQGDLPVWNDWELGVRLLCRRPQMAFTDRVSADVYSQAESITGTGFSPKAGQWEKSLEAVEGHLAASGLKDVPRYLRLAAWRRVCLAADYAREGHGELAAPLMETVMNGKTEPRVSGFRHKCVMRLLYAMRLAGMRGCGRLAERLL